MTTTRESLAAAELAYQQAPRATSEPARLARLAAVRQAVADGWTHAAIADAMGKSRGWVGQRAPSRQAAQNPAKTCAKVWRDCALQGRGCCLDPKPEPTQYPAGTSSRAIDRFRRTET